MATANHIRFSTKYQDDETDLVYYGYRHYAPSEGRWSSRDTLGESGGDNLYAFVMNAPSKHCDPLGLETPVWEGPAFEHSSPKPIASTAGPDVTVPVLATLLDVDQEFRKSPNKRCACNNLYSGALSGSRGISAWDIVYLAGLGRGEIFIQKKGTGDWERTVQFRHSGQNPKVYWGGAVNYVLWGRANALCFAAFGESTWSIENAQRRVGLWKALAYGGAQTADAKAFSAYGYYGLSPDSVALPVTNLHTADASNIARESKFGWIWEGL